MKASTLTLLLHIAGDYHNAGDEENRPVYKQGTHMRGSKQEF